MTIFFTIIKALILSFTQNGRDRDSVNCDWENDLLQNRLKVWQNSCAFPGGNEMQFYIWTEQMYYTRIVLKLLEKVQGSKSTLISNLFHPNAQQQHHRKT